MAMGLSLRLFGGVMKKLFIVLIVSALFATAALSEASAEEHEHLSASEYRAYVNGSMERERQEKARERQIIRLRARGQARRGEMRMSILVHRATDEIDRLEMFALAKSEEGQSVLIARIEHLESVLKETKGYLIESKVKIKELEQDLGDLNQECDGFERDLYDIKEKCEMLEKALTKNKRGGG
jgi:uncharacterized protein YgbK (DUF1537 family)